MIGTILRIEALTLNKYETSTMTIDKKSSSLRKHVLLKHSFRTLEEVKGVVMNQAQEEESTKTIVNRKRRSIPMLQIKHCDGKESDTVSNARQCDYYEEDDSDSESSEEEQDSDDDDFGTVNGVYSRGLRSLEFKLLIDNSNKNRSKAIASPNPSKAKSVFSSLAFKISSDIQSTTSKLHKLTQLINRKSLFDDKQLEINELTYIIKQDLSDLNTQINQLQSQFNNSNKHHQHHQHESNVVISLQNKLANTSFSFKDLLEIRTQNIKKSKQRSEKFQSLATTSQQPQQSDSPLYNNLNKQNTPTHRKKQRNSDVLALDLEDSVEQGGNYAGQQEQALMTNQNNYLQDRSSAIDTIESTITELGQIFSQLSSMVAIQGETVQRIDADVQDISDNVYGAQSELLKYYESIKSNRMLMFKLFGVIIIFVTHKEMLHEYVASNDLNQLQQAPVDKLELVDDNGLTPLALAAKVSNMQAVDILLSKNANPYAALAHASDPQMAQKLHASLQPPPFYPPPLQHFYPYPPPMDMHMYYPEDQSQQQQQPPQPPQSPFNAQIGTLPPPEVARNIPCRFYPGCRYGTECIFMHPQPAMYLPPPPQIAPQFEPIPQPQPQPFYQMPPQMVPPPFAPPIAPNSIPAEQAQAQPEDTASPVANQDDKVAAFQPQQPPPFMHPMMPQDPYMMPIAPRPPPMMMPNAQPFRNNRNLTRSASISKRGKDGQLPPCYFFPMGKCRNQDTCAFPHIIADGTDVRDPALRGTAPINSANSHRRQSSRSNNFENKRFSNGISQLNGNPQASFSGNKIPPSMPRAQAQAAASRTHSPAQRVPTQDDFPSLSSNVSSSSDNGNYSSVKDGQSTAQTTPSSSLVLNNITNSVSKEFQQQSFAAAASSTLAVGA
ncbi:hypothetical protein E3P99_02340 [Wallemia hederae]|uniref:t-SNARE coiled-coil homology domain-containing protein n=1 Tax=Wallemia hederae TaxID=1540922 RepID=A0A4T0FPY0_9BASI|nr:hypothetical protein E3P99_02340 [Wallemia hederae]